MKTLLEVIREAAEERNAEKLAQQLTISTFVAGLAGLPHHFPFEFRINLFLTTPVKKGPFLTELAALGEQYDAAIVALARKHYGENNVRSSAELEALHPQLQKTLHKAVGADTPTSKKPPDDGMRRVFEEMLANPALSDKERKDIQRDFEAMFGPIDDASPDAAVPAFLESEQPDSSNS